MGRRPCCAKEGLNRGAWTAWEDKILINFVKVHGEGKWRDLPQRAGLLRCGKSCQFRWFNYLRPDIKRGNFSLEEEELIIRLHKLLGNRWSIIAGRLPGRTDNEIKNYWKVNLSKRMQGDHNAHDSNKQDIELRSKLESTSDQSNRGARPETHPVIRPKAVRCTKVVIPSELDHDKLVDNNNIVLDWNRDFPSSSASQLKKNSHDYLLDFDFNELLISDILSTDGHQDKERNERAETMVEGEVEPKNMSSWSNDFLVSGHEAKIDDSMDVAMAENWRESDHFQPNDALDLERLSSFLYSEDEWII